MPLGLRFRMHSIAIAYGSSGRCDLDVDAQEDLVKDTGTQDW
jgi:hypothetical protein